MGASVMPRRRKIPKIIMLLDPSRGYERGLLQGIWQYSNAQIAEDIGYSSDKHIARYFHRQTGMTPRTY